MVKYTLVQHSGAGYANVGEFAKAVEERSLTVREVAKVRKAGGLILDSYGEAQDRAMEENYPPEVVGLIPRANGRFHPKIKIDGLRLYLPKGE